MDKLSKEQKMLTGAAALAVVGYGAYQYMNSGEMTDEQNKSDENFSLPLGTETLKLAKKKSSMKEKPKCFQDTAAEE